MKELNDLNVAVPSILPSNVLHATDMLSFDEQWENAISSDEFWTLAKNHIKKLYAKQRCEVFDMLYYQQSCWRTIYSLVY